MKRFGNSLVLLMGLFLALNVWAVTENSAFVLDNGGGPLAVTQLGTLIKGAGFAQATWDATVGSQGLSTAAVSLGVRIPKSSIITRSFLQVVTPILMGVSTTSIADTISFHCEDTGNIISAADIRGKSAGSFLDGVESGASTGFRASLAADCNISSTVAGTKATTGKVNVFVQYVTVDAL